MLKYWKTMLFAGIILIGGLVAVAYVRTMNRTMLEFRIRINRELVLLSVYGEPPTFAIWLENGKGDLENIYVTHRAFQNDWEGKPEVPVALPYWFGLNRSGEFDRKNDFVSADAISGATPREEEFAIRVEVPPDSVFRFWIEMNLSGDYNEYYKESDPENKTADEFGNGQPALIYSGKVRAVPGEKTVPELIGMSLVPDSTDNIIQKLKGITTADQVFSSIGVEVVRPKPYLIR